jgi:hypothetical protein
VFYYSGGDIPYHIASFFLSFFFWPYSWVSFGWLESLSDAWHTDCIGTEFFGFDETEVGGQRAYSGVDGFGSGDEFIVL